MNSGLLQAAAARLLAQIAGGLIGLRVAAFENSGALNDPLGVATEPLMQMLIGDHGIGDIAPRADDAHTREVRIATYLFEVESTVTPLESGRNPSWFSPREARKQLAEGRSPQYAKQIVNIIDSAIDSLTAHHQRSASILMRAQGRRRMAPAR